MKKLKLVGAVGGAISLALCWPLAVGQIGQNVITDGLKHISNDDISAALISYDRGYLSSHAQTRFSVTSPILKQQMLAEGLPTEVTVNSEIRHGLVGISTISTFPDYPESPLVINSTTQLNGNTSYSSKLDNWHFRSEGPDSVAISILSSELSGTVTTLGKVNFNISIPSIALNFASGENMLFSDLTGQGDGKQDAGFWIGKQNITLGSLTVDDGLGTTLFAVDNTSYQFESKLDADKLRFTSNHKLNVDQFTSEDGEVNNVQLDFTLGAVDSKAFLALSNIYQSNPYLGSDDIQQAMPHIDSLFSKGFFISMSPFALNLGEGEFTSKATLNFPEGTNNVSKDPSVIVSALTGGLEAFVSNQLVADYPIIQQGVDELLLMEMMTQNDQGYQLNADIKEGNVVFSNGHKVPLFTLFMSAMMVR
ncbi:DUF945 family protein [Vibrio ziniensis]|uniref:DUF945 family protein n=1 Tax=Vibrio ziniensis TaxID=2711221 RepID=A0A6G7CGY8_9VIBR|nr:DUF945 family protein [Vibrio ziniensis]QIH41411.1 DUF945 family protein [Vibrio ziniensis]